MLVSACVGTSILRSCTEVGQPSVDTTCTWGCLETGEPHCGQLVPAGGAVTSADLDPASLQGLGNAEIAGTLDSDAGTINGMPAGDFRIVNGIAVFRFESLALGNLQLVGSHAIALVSDSALEVQGVIDARGRCTTTPQLPGPGGFDGGVIDDPGSGPGGGGGGSSNTLGGGGGGNGGSGGSGGNASADNGGPTAGDATISTLFGGSGGGGGSQQSQNRGGPGGGALQLVSNQSISIGQNGGINAGGCRSLINNCGSCTSGGGGAGGTILLEAPSVTIDGKLAVNGGGASGAGGQGSDGTLDRIPAPGGPTGNGGPGGAGAAGATLDGESAPMAGSRPGGGGGGIGRIRVDVLANGVVLGVMSVMSPAFDDAPSTATLGSATVQ